jgi:hypothetical protein
MFCSSFYTVCLDDIPAYIKAAEKWGKLTNNKVEFYYLDHLENDNCDKMGPLF